MFKLKDNLLTALGLAAIPSIFFITFLFSVSAIAKPDLVLETKIITQPKSVHEFFLVEATVKNKSQNIQIITVWQCDKKENWPVDNEGLFLKEAKCPDERLTRVLLNPGQQYQRRLTFKAHFMQDIRKPINFRVGFITIEDPDYLGTIRYADEPLWGQTLTLDYQIAA